MPNFSEGRDPTVVARIGEAIAQVPGAAVLGQTSDCDHNRSVVTFAGAPAAVAEGAFRAIECAVALIDMNHHHGVHPRVGAADVVPLVPVAGVTMEDCVRLAGELGERVWRQLRVPVYLYESAARRPERVNLANIRHGRWEKLRDEIGVVAERTPDIGEPRLHPTAGACVIGARKFLIAFNINLATGDAAIARRIAGKIRFSSGGLPCVKALGFFLESRGIAQVSINLTDYEVTPLCAVIEAVRDEAERAGVGIAAMELIGLIPRKGLETGAGCELHFENFNDGLIVENRLEELL